MSDLNDSDQLDKLKIVPDGMENELEKLVNSIDNVSVENSASENSVVTQDSNLITKEIDKIHDDNLEMDGILESTKDTAIVGKLNEHKIENEMSNGFKEEDEPINIFPEYQLFRNDYREHESQEYMPKDLITLILINTGTTKRTEIRMIDSRGDVRYHGMSGGDNHEWTTRIQNTRVMGDWRFEVIGILKDEKLDFNIDIPFVITEYVPDPIIVPEIVDVEITADLTIPETQYNIPIIKVKGIGKHYETILHSVDIYYFKDFLMINLDEVSEKTEIRVDLFQNWINFVKIVFEDPTHPLLQEFGGKGESLYNGTETPSIIKGIGPKTEEKLKEAGYINIKLLSKASTEEIISKIGGNPIKIESWIADAKEKLTETASVKEDPLLDNIEEQTADIIVGVGPATLRKLEEHGLGTINSIVKSDISVLIEIFGDKKGNKIMHGAQSIIN